MDRLDPKLDITFKLLFSRYPELLRNMLEAVLGEAIEKLTILNPAVLGELARDKKIELDLRVQLKNGTRIAVEMQIRFDDTLADRFVYYAAREHGSQLARGADYSDLRATIVVVWMLQPLVAELEQYHSIFELRERSTQRLLSSKLAIHVLQLAHIDAPSAPVLSPAEAALRRWGRFLLAATDRELNALENEDPIMTTARTALDELSQDPDAARAARYREEEVKLNQIAIAHAARRAKREGELEGELKGELKGKLEGELKGKLEAKREAILVVLASRGVVVAEEVKARIAAETDTTVLDGWLTRAVVDDVFQP